MSKKTTAKKSKVTAKPTDTNKCDCDKTTVKCECVSVDPSQPVCVPNERECGCNKTAKELTISQMFARIRASIDQRAEWFAQQIASKAAELAKEDHTYDDWVWFTAEAELRFTASVNGNKKEPIAEPKIRAVAEEIAQKQPTVQDLHWLLAERRFYTSLIP